MQPSMQPSLLLPLGATIVSGVIQALTNMNKQTDNQTKFDLENAISTYTQSTLQSIFSKFCQPKQPPSLPLPTETVNQDTTSPENETPPPNLSFVCVQKPVNDLQLSHLTQENALEGVESLPEEIRVERPAQSDATNTSSTGSVAEAKAQREAVLIQKENKYIARLNQILTESKALAKTIREIENNLKQEDIPINAENYKKLLERQITSLKPLLEDNSVFVSFIFLKITQNSCNEDNIHAAANTLVEETERKLTNLLELVTVTQQLNTTQKDLLKKKNECSIRDLDSLMEVAKNAEEILNQNGCILAGLEVYLQYKSIAAIESILDTKINALQTAKSSLEKTPNSENLTKAKALLSKIELKEELPFCTKHNFSNKISDFNEQINNLQNQVKKVEADNAKKAKHNKLWEDTGRIYGATLAGLVGLRLLALYYKR